MITPGTNWNLIPKAEYVDLMAAESRYKFVASTSTKEKMMRAFNICVFALPLVALTGVKLPFAATLVVGAALILAVRKVLEAAIGHIVYPVVLESYIDSYDKSRLHSFHELKGFSCRRIALAKLGYTYDSFAIEHDPKAPWALVAGGNGWIGEEALCHVSSDFKKRGLNVLYVNGPGVARSRWFPTRYSMGAAQEAGLQLLEEVVKAKKIVLYGTSLGGGAQAEAICMHQFKEGVQYLVWSDRTFDFLSNAAGDLAPRIFGLEGSGAKVFGSVVKGLFYLIGLELDSVAGAKRLKELDIRHIVTQNYIGVEEGEYRLPYEGEIVDRGTDGIITDNSSLYLGIRRAGLTDGESLKDRLKLFGSNNVDHNGSLPVEVEKLVRGEIGRFIGVFLV